ncbi:hypothetical protein BDR05DRAFT_963268 [Suillus weaverae]|nr:hypothetical protein BDR05DRAFT_963268 [Suillus weaverae]
MVPTLIPLQVPFLLAFPRSSTAFDPTMLKRTNFRDPQDCRGSIHIYSSLAYPR